MLRVWMRGLFTRRPVPIAAASPPSLLLSRVWVAGARSLRSLEVSGVCRCSGGVSCSFTPTEFWVASPLGLPPRACLYTVSVRGVSRVVYSVCAGP